MDHNPRSLKNPELVTYRLKDYHYLHDCLGNDSKKYFGFSAKKSVVFTGENLMGNTLLTR